jgi:acetyl-CoA synthetase
MPEASKHTLELTPAWVPSLEFIQTTNIAWLMRRTGMNSYEALRAWSVRHRDEYWKLAIERLGVAFRQQFDRIMDLSDGPEQPRWLPGAKYNIVESCFAAPADSPAIIYQAQGGPLASITVGELRALAIHVGANLRRRGFQANDRLAIIMPMTAESVAIYLGIILAGCVAVGIADSFQPKEIATRVHAARVSGVFTQDFQVRSGKLLALYANVIEADSPRAIVLPAKDRLSGDLREGDLGWSEFLGPVDHFEPVPREPSDPITILFSSGTTGEPKAIPWTMTTPIKCAADAHFHQDVHPGDVLVWPTNLGWMMGPWLVFASLINRAAMGLFYGAPTGAEFGRFVQDAKATMLGVVPSLVRTWRHTDCMRDLNWHDLKVLSSTGECSHRDDMNWLMSLAGGRPVIEYCGGTEIGGAYITGTVTKPCVPATFNTAALGLDFVILDDRGMPAENGEAFVVPPSIGLSNTLLNKDHHEIYFAGTPVGPNGQGLRRHGDEMQNLGGGYWRALGRADDTMNLGGIKVSSAEIEQALQSVPQVKETAAIAISPDGGPSQLIIYAACSAGQSLDKGVLKTSMQDCIKRDLNPLFKIHDLILVDALPRTPSNKVMRRVLRDGYLSTL